MRTVMDLMETFPVPTGLCVTYLRRARKFMMDSVATTMTPAIPSSLHLTIGSTVKEWK
jgi:hypothetical protein